RRVLGTLCRGARRGLRALPRARQARQAASGLDATARRGPRHRRARPPARRARAQPALLQAGAGPGTASMSRKTPLYEAHRRVRADHFLIVVNASNIDKDVAHFTANVGTWCELRNASDETALIAFQGPRAEAALQPLSPAPLGSLKTFHFLPDAKVAGRAAWIARTGYTGEDGFELFCAASDAEALWGALVEAADAVGGKPVGLG